MWLPATIIEPLSPSGKLEIQYTNQDDISFIYSLIGVRRHGEKRMDYEWREKLKERDIVLYYYEREW